MMCCGTKKNSYLTLVIKPRDGNISMREFQEAIKQITPEGVRWGSSGSLPVGYGTVGITLRVLLQEEKMDRHVLLSGLRRLWCVREAEWIE